MQNLLDSQNERLATLQAEKEVMAMGHHDESTGQSMVATLPAASHCVPPISGGWSRR